jgi:hypothetical protein
MGRRRKYKSMNPNAHLFVTYSNYQIPDSNRVIEEGEVIKIAGEHGKKFQFKQYVQRSDTGVEWIDCYELEKGVFAGWRSFRPNRIKPLPKKRKRNII